MDNSQQNELPLVVAPNAPDVGDEKWESYETRWGRYGNPGFTRLFVPASMPSVFLQEEPVDIIVDLYRGEDGQLLGIYYSRMVENVMDDGTLKDIQKPIAIFVHPNHRGEGIGTKLSDNAVSEFFKNKGYEWDYNLGLNEIRTTSAGANFVNSWIMKNYGDSDSE